MTSLSSHASYKVYEAEISDSSWQFSGNPLQCNLSHSVPEYGKGSFFKGAGKNQQLKFSMGYKRQPVAAVKVASVQSMSPSWFPKQSAKLLGELKILNGKSIFQTENTASWKLLSELETGRFPMFRYQEFASLEDQVSVSLSAVGFKNPYNQFLDCLNTLVPYKLEELKKMTLRFDFAKDKVKPPYREKLRALAQYIRHDSELEVVFISGHTDSKGSRNYNHKLSERRIASVQQILTLPGTDSNRFNSLAHGERKPVASNRKSSGRALNRRVYIRVE
ncbi:MAG: OmpA family protein [Kangiellaceae bacterium]|nr:OmpA family protein [Kangiellaceae bacterium]